MPILRCDMCGKPIKQNQEYIFLDAAEMIFCSFSCCNRMMLRDKMAYVESNGHEDIIPERSTLYANDYQRAALRTAKDKCRSLENCAMGLSGEVGEAVDIIKKHLFHDHELDKEHLAKELGDILWYLSVLAFVIGYNLEDVMQMNIEKLWQRYPEGFDPEKSKNRKEGDI